MKKIQRKILLTSIILTLFFMNFGFVSLRNNQTIDFSNTSETDLANVVDYFKDTNIPNLIEGTAKMFDTETYFDDYPIKKCYANIKLVYHNISNLEIAIGYKPTTYDLCDVPDMKDGLYNKEIILWKRQNFFTEASTNISSVTKRDISEDVITLQWDLTSVGFSINDYVKGDERIWYLKISSLDNNSLGAYIEETYTIDGQTFTDYDFKPYINYIESFELQYDSLVFKTLLHPFFDGSTEVVVPIRGVDHEFSVITDQVTKTPIIREKSAYRDENESHSSTKNRWAVVWACSCDNVSINDPPGTLSWIPVESCAFILGCYQNLANQTNWLYSGIYDYGWNVAYCMDEHINGDAGKHPLKTCSYVTDEYFEEMMVTVNGYLGTDDELIVFTHSHGFSKSGEYYMFTDESSKPGVFYKNFIACESHWYCASYFDEIGDITADDTYVFLITKSCHSNSNDSTITTGINNFPSGDENDHLLTWSWANILAVNGAQNGYNDFYWYNGIGTQHFKPLSYLFNYSYGGYNINTISDIIEDDNFYNGDFHPKTYWGDYNFKLKRSYTIENFDLFYKLLDNAYISSTHTNSQIQFSYSSGGTSGVWLNESYFLIFPATDDSDDFSIEVTANWSVGANATLWESLLEVGTFNFSSQNFDAFLAIGTQDNYTSSSGRFQAMVNDNWYYDDNTYEVQLSRTSIVYHLSRTYGQFLCRIKQGTTTLFQLVSNNNDFDSINAIRLFYSHKANTATGTSSWTIWDIYAEINY